MADKLKTGVKDGEGVWGSAVEYAIYQEFGTRKMRAQPYITPAAAIVKAKAGGTFKKGMEIEITKKLANKYKQMISEGVTFESANIEQGITDGVNASIVALLVAATAQSKSMAPVDTANLKGSIMWKTKNKDGGYGA
jgi:hypothetical protein